MKKRNVKFGFTKYKVSRRKWQPTPVSLPGKSHGHRSLVGCSPWGGRVRHHWATNTYLLIDSIYKWMSMYLSHCLKVEGLVAKLCLTLLWPMDSFVTRTLCPWDSPGKNTGAGCHFFLQGIIPTQGSTHARWSHALVSWDRLSLSRQGSPRLYLQTLKYGFHMIFHVLWSILLICFHSFTNVKSILYSWVIT